MDELDDVFRFSRMLLLETGVEEFPYHPGGSCFLIVYHGCLLLVTASHCLENNKADPNDVCVLDGSGTDTLLTFDRISRGKPNPDIPEDIDHADFAIFRVRQNTVSGTQLRQLHPFPLSERTLIQPESSSVRIFVTRGYPIDMNPVDYDNHKIPQKSLTLDGRYDGPDQTQKHLWILRYGKCGEPIANGATNGNGMSGSPVLAFNGTKLPRFAGVILRGGHTSGIWRVASPFVLWSALRDLDKRGEIQPLSDDLLRSFFEFNGVQP